MNLWRNLQVFVGKSLLNLIEDEGENWIQILNSCLSFIKIFMEKNSIHEGLEKSVFLMHESLLALPKNLDSTKNEIAKICENWFLKDLPQKENLIMNAVVYLLQKTIQASGIVSNFDSCFGKGAERINYNKTPKSLKRPKCRKWPKCRK